jgi:uncharacterized hydrophobic protein (TIGR00271 family)
MRPVFIQVPEGNGSTVIDIALRHKAKNLNLVKGINEDKSVDIVTTYISNSRIEALTEELNSITDVQITIYPQGVLPLYPPQSEAPDQAVDVELRSPIEIFLSGLQSIGSWKGFTGYAILTGIVVWIGLYTNTGYLLVAAMLIAPFAGPAMNTAIATARGDSVLLKNSIRRYFAAIGITIFISWLITLLFGQNITTELMVERSKISSAALLLALSAGAAGGINLIQSERDSLVSGAAVGMLVAASLAPPAGMVGMAAAMNRWDISLSGIFLILLQLAGINFTGAIIFKLAGLKSKGPRYNRGKKHIITTSFAITILILLFLAYWQFSTPVEFERASISKTAAQDIKEIIEADNNFTFIDLDARFTRTDTDENLLLLTIYLVSKSGDTDTTASVEKEILSRIKTENITPLLNFIFLEKL